MPHDSELQPKRASAADRPTSGDDGVMARRGTTHEVCIYQDRCLVVKRFRSWDRGEPAREWAALTLLAESAPGLAPAPAGTERARAGQWLPDRGD